MRFYNELACACAPNPPPHTHLSSPSFTPCALATPNPSTKRRMLLGYWGSYAVKHFIETAKELVKLGWKQYIPTSDNPRDSAEVMEARMAVEFGGRIPNVLLFLQDYDIMDREKYPRKLLSETSYLCWYDDTPFSGFPPQYAAGLDDATLLLPTYEYLQQRTPSLASVPRVWMPHSALPAFESLPFNTDPREKVLLVGAVMGGVRNASDCAGQNFAGG